ncbi:amino acid transporter AVT6C-like isoform X1 [Zingiber officinale]|uniref:amino acid transporter AVT6C-like isoform X1 n=1 Tax=Zingiber officinale TaxID=94328 RepID=UPI001C4D0DD7|nr:amino acid transporter AVT6C-like isoform X1 [Zingiber officinale]
MSKAGDAVAPLLPVELRPSETPSASVPGAVFNLATTTIGAGIMSLPAAVKVLGVAPALVLVVAAAFLADASAEFLMRYRGAGGAWSYAAAMGDAFGRAGSAALQICVALTTAGTLTVYLDIIGDVLSGSQSEGAAHAGILQEWFGEQWWTARVAAQLVAVVIVILPLVLLRRVDSLKFSSAVSVLLAVVFMCISTGMALYALFQGRTQKPRLLPDFAHLSSFLDLFTAVPIIVVAFTFHFNVHPIRAELSETSDMQVAVRLSVLLCSAIYAAIGFFGYLLFGEATMTDILSNFDRDTGSAFGSLLNDVVRLSYVLHLVLVFPLLFFSLRINVDELLFPKSSHLSSDARRFTLLTTALLGSIYLGSVLIPSIWTLFQFIGSTTAVCISLIFPAALVLRDVEGTAKRKDRLLARGMILVALITSAIAIGSNIVASFQPREVRGSRR